MVWWASPIADARRALAHLDASERARYRDYRHRADAARFATGRALAKAALGRLLGRPADEIRLDADCPDCGGHHGKPQLRGSGIELSIAHAGERVGVAVLAGAPVGIDVETLGGDAADLPLETLTATERDALASIPPAARVAGFLQYWTRKEAVLKATGHGLAIDPHELAVSAPWEAPRLERWAATTPLAAPVLLRALSPGDGYVAHLAALTDRPLTVVELT